MKKRLFLIDASGYIFRAYYAIRPLSNSKGLPTNALYGFTTMLLKLLEDQKPDLVGVVFDVARKTFRNDLYPAYKANRSEPPADLVPQFPYFRKIVKALSLPVLELANYEADDVIGTIACQMEKKEIETIVVSGDKDLMQLVDDSIYIYDPMKDKWIREPEVVERFGVPPNQVIDILGLAGDTSDNIPGVPGVGEKTAMKLVQEYGPIESIIENAAKIPGKLGEKIREHAAQAILCKKLATVMKEVPITYDLETFHRNKPHADELKTLFEELEFKKLLVDLTEPSSSTSTPASPAPKLSANEYCLVQTEEKLDFVVSRLSTLQKFSFDTETTSIDALQAKLVGISLGLGNGESYYLPIGHTASLFSNHEPQLSLAMVREKLKPVFENKNIAKVAQNAKYDLHVLNHHGIQVYGVSEDTLIASYLIDPDSRHNLDILAQHYLNHQTIKYEDVTGTGKKQISFAEVALDKARDYSCEDADVTLRLHDILSPLLAAHDLEKVYRNIEIPLIEVLQKMEGHGVLLDVAFLKRTSDDYGVRLQQVEEEVYEKAGKRFNLGSPKQLAQILFEDLKLPVVRKTKTGYSTDVDVLTELAKVHEVPRLLMTHRSLSKLKSTYLDALISLVHPETGRVHTTFNQTIAASGRLSSSDPNLQNIPIRSEEGKKIREAFIAAEGCVLMSADYSQIELRLLAHFSKDPVLVKAFEDDLDIHRATASRIFNVPESDVTSNMRSVGKTVNFAVLYGQGAYSLSQQLEVSVSEAEKYIRNYFEEYASVSQLKETILAEAVQKKETRTLFGRLRKCPEINSSNKNVRAMTERTAFNTVFQGSAADLIKKAMIDIHHEISEKFPSAKMLLQVHDELVFEVEDKDVVPFKSCIKALMENVEKLAVPLRVDVGVGKNWAEAH